MTVLVLGAAGFIGSAVVAALGYTLALSVFAGRSALTPGYAKVAIGVTAVARGATLLTRNVRDFAGIAGLDVADPEGRLR